MERIFLSAQNLFVKKRRFNTEAVKILIAAYAFFFNCSAENRISKQQFFDFQIFAFRENLRLSKEGLF